MKGRLTRDRAITLGFVVFSIALALWQRPGWATSDTKIDLQVDPVRFLSSVASVWTSTTDLGEVHSAQYSGYLWPMGPFFAALHSIGIGTWLVQRLWLAVLLALSVWGMLKLLDALIGRPRGVAHVVATAFFLLNPYVAVFTARTTITLLGYAALPWLLLITYRGVRAPGWRNLRGWMWAAAFALVLTSTGGGVNAAVVAWMLIGPVVLLLYEPAIGAVRWRDSLGFLFRAGLLAVLVSLWWIAPLLVHVRYGIDFLQFTEQPASIWATNSITESLRLMGYWTSYIGVGFGVNRPFFSDGSTFLFNPLVVGATLLLPAIALAGFARARRRSYALLFVALVVVGVIIMMAGFPDGTPLRGAMLWVYRHVFVLRFARTTNKAAPLVAVGLAGLLGLTAQQLVAVTRRLGRVRLRRPAAAGVAIALLAMMALAALPLIRGQAIDTQLEFKRIPTAWRQAGQGLDRTLPRNTRALVLPGQIFAYYKWGGTLDAILPRLTSRPVAVRYETPYSDLHAVDLLTTVDDLVQQRRLVPGQLSPLLALMGVGAVVTGADDDISRSGAIDPAAAAGVLTAQLGPTPSSRYGPVHSLPPAAGDVGPSVALPQVRRYNVASGRGIVHVDPTASPTIVDGGAQGLADLGAFGGLPSRSPLFYAGDLTPGALRAQAAGGANVVITDSNRRREFLPQSTQQNLGPTLTAAEPLPTNAAVINPFAPAGTNAQTVTVLQGARYLNAPTQAGELQFPEHAPIAAFDGDLSTSWVADRYLPSFDRWIEIGFNAPRDVPYVDVYPLSGAHGIVTEVDVNGIRHAVGPGRTRIVVNLRHVSALRVTIDHVRQPQVGLGGPGGFREIRIPGVAVHELLRTPVITARALSGTDLRRDSLTYVFERTTGDDPFRRDPPSTSTILNTAQARGDAEQAIDRVVFGLTPRSYSARAWVYPAVGAPDSALDRLVGVRGPEQFNSSARFQNQPAYRASSAFDGHADPGWIGVWAPGQIPLPWISWSGARTLTVTHLQITAPGLAVRHPTVVRLSWPGGQTPPLTVGAGGAVVPPVPIRARAIRLTVLEAAFPAGLSSGQRQAAAVGIGSVSVPGLAPVSVPRQGPLRPACGVVTVELGGNRLPLELAGSIQQLDAGQAVSARPCAAPVPMGAGIQEIRVLPGAFSADLLQLQSPAPVPAGAAAPRSVGSVIDPGRVGQSSVDGVRVALHGPAWLVLGESFDTGWQATCNGRSLGAPRPIDGYANGWPAPAGCRQVRFFFAPQSGVQASYLVSGVVVLALLVLLGAGAWRLPRRREPGPAPLLLPDPPRGGLALPRAIATAVAIAVPIGAIFALRAGAVAFPLLVLLLWRGFGPAALTWMAVGLLGIVVPIVYLIISPSDLGGYNFQYSTSLIDAHWIGVAGVLLLAVAGGKMIAAARSGRRSPPPSSPLDEREQDPVGAVEQEVVRG